MTLETVVMDAFKVAVRRYLPLAGKTLGAFDRQLWRAALDFYRGDIDAFQFIDEYINTIDAQLTKAWNEGAREVGFDPRDMTDDDLEKLKAIIDSEHEHILGLAGDIENARLTEMDIASFRSQFRPRIDLWVNRYTETVNEAKLYFGGRQKLVWKLGATEEHCTTCASLNGIVAFATEWNTAGIHPQNPPNDLLECGGWRCDCSLNVTTERHTPDALDKLLFIATQRGI